LAERGVDPEVPASGVSPHWEAPAGLHGRVGHEPCTTWRVAVRAVARTHSEFSELARLFPGDAGQDADRERAKYPVFGAYECKPAY
jgi:hypothetical protein